MSKTLTYFIIAISLGSIFFSVYAMFKGQKFLDASGGIVIGLGLLGILYFEKMSKK
ncbi:hypothetical protein [uncultured Polaribacter sp.]|uniref:hypothetical protein n=1 Tax=uncultured Polaribacter sp. TaxID=174711 RepID=UPI00262DEB4A|nr:hypothetical protein [uncultured Polaribacter sp.]